MNLSDLGCCFTFIELERAEQQFLKSMCLAVTYITHFMKKGLV